MRRGALLLFVCLGALAASAAPALAAWAEPVVTGAVNNVSAALPLGSAGVGMQAGPLSESQDVAVSGHYAYVPSYFDGTLAAVDLNDPNLPAIDSLSSIGTVPSSGTQVVGADTVKVFNGVAYVLSKNLNASTSNNDIGVGNSLTMFDVSGQYVGNPLYLGSYTDSNKLFGAYGVAVASNSGQTYAYVAAQGCLPSPQPCSNGGVGNNFVVLNVTDPASPTYVTEIHNSATGQWPNALHHPTAVVVSGNYAYVTSYNNAQVAVIDISNPASPNIVATIQNDANNDVVWPNDLAISGHYLLIDNQSGGGPIAVVDISNPLHRRSSPASAQPTSRTRTGSRSPATSPMSPARVRTQSPRSTSRTPWPRGSPGSSPTTPTSTGRPASTSCRQQGVSTSVSASGHQPGDGSDTYPPYPPGISAYPPVPPFSYTSGNSANTGTVAAIEVDPVPNSVTITPSSEPPTQTTQTTASFSFSTEDAVATTACSLDGASSGPCTTPGTMSYTGLAGGPHTFTVQSSDAAGNTTSDGYCWTVGAPTGPPVNCQPPTITGTAQQGQTLTEVNGTWANVPSSYASQWEDCDVAGGNCQPISGATGQTYAPTNADVGHTLVVTETATNSLGAGYRRVIADRRGRLPELPNGDYAHRRDTRRYAGGRYAPRRQGEAGDHRHGGCRTDGVGRPRHVVRERHPLRVRLVPLRGCGSACEAITRAHGTIFDQGRRGRCREASGS